GRAKIRSFRVISGACFFIMTLVGLLTLSEYLFGWNLGMDQLLFKEPAGAVRTIHLGRMAPDTAVCFVLFAVGSWIVYGTRKNHRLILTARLIAGLVLIGVALTAILSYSLLGFVLLGWGNLTAMAFHTAIIFLALGVVTILETLREGLAPGISRFSKDLQVSGILIIILTMVFGLYVQSTNQENYAQVLRHQSFLLADELRQSSDDLTRMVRTYVVTGDPVYKQHYQDILDIRNGKNPRPEEYWRIYWDLVLAGSPVPRSESRQSIPLLELMRQAGFTKEEFRKLAEANANSDELTIPEFEAMKLAESLGPESKADREKAIRILHDKKYHQAKYGIMKPIDECIEMVDRRTLATVKNTHSHTGILQWMFIALGLGLILMLFRTYAALRETLGDSLDNVYAQIKKIGTGDFASFVEIKDSLKNSVIGWLFQTQTKLRAYSDERKKADEAIAAAKDYTENIIKSMFDTLVVINADGKITSVNKATAVLLGYEEEELIGKPFGTIVAEEEEEEGIPFIGSRLKELMKAGFIKEYDMTYKTKSGEMIPVSFSGAVMRDKDGELIGIVCIGRDLRERKKMEDMLQNEKNKLTAIFASAPVGMLLLDEETVIVDASSAAAVMVLKDPAQIIQQRAGGGLNCIHSLENKKGCGFSIACPECPLRKGILQVLTTGSSIRGAEIQLTLMINGQEHRPWLRISAEPILLGGRKHVVVAIDDITESKKTEEALRESEERYHALFVESRDAMMTLLPGAGFLSGNPVAIRMFGCRDEKSFTSQSPASLSPKYQPDGVLSSDKAQEMIMLALEKGVNFFEWTHKRIDGTEFPATVLLSKVEKGGKAYLQATVRDITEHKRSEEALKESQEQLFQTSKLASLGQLSAGAAHEINNPLAGIVGFTEATLLDLKNERIAPERIAHDLKIILKNAERCKVIISNLLNFARAKELQRKESDINSLIDDAMALVEYKTAAQNIKVVRKYEKNPRKVSIDQDQMMQVLINVISNAQNAMPDGGEMLVRTGSEDNFALIEVKDTGIGIEKENLLKVFDPFFTTREPGQGVGLGLSISYSIMKRHEGSIEAKSDGKNKGASFIIKIPV
ncbi:MAG: PAS domain S-box protein, partial [Candidatus Omnitrophota bacterium]|nr:PAS domain S-box protein [Candidatus Omnitrophota bacterium]